MLVKPFGLIWRSISYPRTFLYILLLAQFFIPEDAVAEVLMRFNLDDDPGWSTEGDWEFGVPRGMGSGAGDPISGATGANVYGYNLDGDYPDFIDFPEYLTTTPLDFSAFSNVELTFKRWLGIESSEFDQAAIQVSSDGLSWIDVWTHSGGTLSESNWSTQRYDISSIADGESTVYIRWSMGATDSTVTYPGWNIDDIVFEGTSPRRGVLKFDQTKYNCTENIVIRLIDIDLDGEGSVKLQLRSNIGEVESVVLAEIADGVFEATLPIMEGVIMPENGIIDSQTSDQTLYGQYADTDVGDSTSAVIITTTDILACSDVGSRLEIERFDLNTNPGWTTEGDWEFGIPLGWAGDPASGATGSNVYGNNLQGVYGDVLAPYYLTTTPLEFVLVEDIELRFSRWLDIESSKFDHAAIQVSNDSAIWKNVWTHNGGSIFESSWSTQVYDISYVADGEPTVYVRWVMGPTDEFSNYAGWNIDDIIFNGREITGRVQFIKDRFNCGDPISVRLIDPDLNGVGSYMLTIETSEGDAENLDLNEIQPGVFEGFVRAEKGSLAVGNGIIDGTPMSEQIISISYVDLDDGESIPRTLNDIAVLEFCSFDVIEFYDLSIDPGWQVEGLWAFGVPSGMGSSNGDPTTGNTGENVYGYNLDGDYANSASVHYLTTTAIDLSDVSNTQLQFYRWLGVGHSSNDNASLEVSNDGVTWSPVWTHEGSAITESHWSLQRYDTSLVADAQSTVYLRWAMGETGDEKTFPGWNIDDIRILGSFVDEDKDGMRDKWELTYGLNTSIDDSSDDADGDGLTNLREFQLRLNPISDDTDSDGMPDGWEVDNGLDPLKDDAEKDPDGDGQTNLQEFNAGTDPLNANTSGGSDGVCFFATAAYGTPLAREVDVLRQWRNEYLLSNFGGVAFTDTYYRLSPWIADLVAKNRIAGAAVRTGLRVILFFFGPNNITLVIMSTGIVLTAARIVSKNCHGRVKPR